MVHLKTKRLIIRDPQHTDINGYHKLLSDGDAMYFLQDIKTNSLEESQNNLDIAINEANSENRTKYFLVIENKETGDFIGSVGYTVLSENPVGKVVEVGYFILPEFHGKGYVTEALREVIRFAFEDGGVYRLNIGCLAENHTSERVIQKCGFIKEAEFKSFVWHDGQMKDRVEYRLLRDEWNPADVIITDNFWQIINKFVSESEIIIERPGGSPHPRYPDFIYPLDYGYLKGTTAVADGGGIDIWRGSDPSQKVDAVMCIVDVVKRDSEIKILIGCTEEEKKTVYKVHNDSKFQKGILIKK
jgi:ribosomal-protein-alanine N-acetyltransferase